MNGLAFYLSRAIDELVARREHLRQEQARIDAAIQVFQRELSAVTSARN